MENKLFHEVAQSYLTGLPFVRHYNPPARGKQDFGGDKRRLRFLEHGGSLPRAEPGRARRWRSEGPRDRCTLLSLQLWHVAICLGVRNIIANVLSLGLLRPRRA